MTIDQYSLLSIPFMFDVIYLPAAILDSYCLALKILRHWPLYSLSLSLNITTIRLICMISLCRIEANIFRARSS
jgi:hypothetical protein